MLVSAGDVMNPGEVGCTVEKIGFEITLDPTVGCEKTFEKLLAGSLRQAGISFESSPTVAAFFQFD